MADADTFNFQMLEAKAKKLAGENYQPPNQVPSFLSDLSASQLARINFKHEDALWAKGKLPFQLTFYHPGAFYDHAVAVHIVDGKQISKVAFDKNYFDYPSAALKNKVPADLGYAGFKIFYAPGSKKKLNEVLSFLGASYFRAVGTDGHFGLSARGLAIDTGNTKKGEEFPSFTDFWLVKPDAKSKQLVIYALLNSPSVTGAYKITLDPGKATHTHVEETLFTRKAISKLGIAPLTSMYTWGSDTLARRDNFRPAAHDSGGLLISSADGEWLWRPVVNPQKLWINDFDANSVHGFGLIQRDRQFADYQDLSDQYQNRPNAWVTPDGDWGKGHLELVEIPSDSEANDNIVVYWVSAKPVKAGARLHYAYDVTWSSKNPSPASLGYTEATRVGLAAVAPGQQNNQVKVVVDFAGGALTDMKKPGSVQPRVNTARDVTLSNIEVQRNPYINGWRLSFLVPESALNSPLNLRAYLAGPNGGGLTETWNFLLSTP